MIEDYIKYLEEKGYSSVTIHSTKNTLYRFCGALRNLFDKKIEEASEIELEEYYLEQKEKLTPGTVALNFGRLRSFYRFLLKRCLLLKNPTEDLFPMRETEYLKDVPSEKALEQLLSEPDEYTYFGIRDKAILELMYSSGLRKMEVQNLKSKDIDLKEGIVKVIDGKGGKDRMLPVGQKAIQMIQKYLEVARPKFMKDPKVENLFLAQTGEGLNGSSIHYVFMRYRGKSNLTKKITAHSLRHACALHMLRGGAPIQAVQTMLGHKKLSTTQIYTKLCPADLKAIHKKYHPRESKKILNSVLSKVS